MFGWNQRRPSESFVRMLVPNVFGATPTVFGAPLAQSRDDLQGADVVFLGIPWSAPTSHGRTGTAAGSYFGTALTPAQFRTNSLKYGGYLPELDLDVFEHLKVVDYGDAEISRDMGTTLKDVEDQVGEIVDAGAIVITMGGNSGPGTYAVVKAIADRAGGPTAVLDFDAHHDNLRGEWEEDDPRVPKWGSAWARRILTLPNIDPERFFFVGLRGPRNDRETFVRFTERGVKREHLYTYAEIKKARRSGFDEWAQDLGERIAGGASKVWIHVDPDVLDLSSNPHFADEPLGPSTDEVIEIIYQVGKAAGRDKFAGMSFVGVPYDAQTLHYALTYMVVYALAGVVSAG
jgi:agmatinase